MLHLRVKKCNKKEETFNDPTDGKLQIHRFTNKMQCPVLSLQLFLWSKTMEIKFSSFDAMSASCFFSLTFEIMLCRVMKRPA